MESATSRPRDRAGQNRAGIPVPVCVLLGLLSAFCVVYELRVTVAPGLHRWFDGVEPDIVSIVAGLALVGRSRQERAWLFLGLGAICWAAGDLYWTLHVSKLSSPPTPSWADAGYLSFCPLGVVGILMLIRRRAHGVSTTLVADALAAALAIASLSAMLVVAPIIDHAQGGTLAVATNLAYPIVDLLLISLIVAAMALSHWRVSRTLTLLGLGVLAFWVSDSLYLVDTAQGTYHLGAWYNPLWYVAPVLFAWAAWLPRPAQLPLPARDADDVRGVVMPLTFACCALGTLVSSSPTTREAVATGLATASMLVVFVRLVLTWRENTALLRASQVEALTDALTGLANRRALMLELARRLAWPEDSKPYLLVLFDLDGFKHYNDQFGHMAGDMLLRRLGHKLGRALEGRGTAYRMGGDEFCAVIDQPHATDSCVRTAAAALTDRGEGFDIGCSFGSIVLPNEATTAEQALRLADHRMYAHKRVGRASASRQSSDVLLRVLGERDPDLGDHVRDVGELAAAVAEACELGPEQVEQIRQAAELHDIGKVAVPDAILNKPGPLSEREWTFIRSHTIIGERILDAAPALRAAATLVRSSHENFDGSGYPDGLAGEDIPLGSRIISVCDAYHAMTTDRPYRTAMSLSDAISELQRCAGQQFDPMVVELFCRALAERDQARSEISSSFS